MPTVKVALDNLAEDATVEVPILGTFQNNSSTEVDELRWNMFVQTPQGERYKDEDTLEISTEQQKREAEAYRRAAETRGMTADELESEYKKDELVDLATSTGIDPSDMNKDELAEELATTNVADESAEGFSSAATRDEEQED